MKQQLSSASLKLFLFCFVAGTFLMSAQLNLPRGSQMAKVSQRVGITDITIKYSRPQVNDREIWGRLVPYGMTNPGFGTATEAPWRAGANENTIIHFTNDVSIGGKSIKAGKYGLHIEVKDENNATLILSFDNGSWGSFFYDPSQDAARVDIKTRQVPHREFLTFEFTEVTPTNATAELIWEKKAFPFTIEVPVGDVVLSDIRSKLKGTPGFNRQSWEQAANFALNNGGDLNEALGWIDSAIAGQFFSQKTFNNTAIKGRIMKAMGKNDEFLKLMDEASTMANMNQLNTLGYQMLGAKEYETALKFFKKNVADNPTNANVHDSLGECYKTMGDKKNAIKHLKKSLSLNPPANVKANSEKLLTELGAL